MSFKERFGMSPVTMIAIVLGVFMAILDNTVVNVAIPKMMSVFAATQNEIQWVVTAYMLVTGMLTPISGYLGDRFGQKRVYLFALAVFTLGSAMAGFAWSTETMIAFRVFQAVGGAMLMPTSMAIMFSLSPPERRGTIMGIWGIALMFAPALGPTLSGYLVEYVDWRLIFYINVPFGILSFFLVTASLPTMRGSKKERFDFWGFITSLIGFFSLLYALSEAPSDGWGSPTIMIFLFLAAVFLALFVAIELTTESPMLDLRLLARRVFLTATITSSLISIALLGVLFILPVFLQDSLGLTPLQTGLLTLPGALVTAVTMPISGYLFDRFGARVMGIFGLIITFATSILYTYLNVNWTFTMIMMLYTIRSLGMGLTMMPVSTAGLNDVPRHLVSRGTALQNTTRNVAGSIGTAFLSTVMQTGSTGDFLRYTSRLSVPNLRMLHQTGTMPSVYGVTNANMLTNIVNYLHGVGFQSGMQAAFLVSATVAGLALFSVLFIGKKQIPVDLGTGGAKPAVAMAE
nr:DHA2 family efflux MFS transporter permease subunit [Bacilli bacterium]